MDLPASLLSAGVEAAVYALAVLGLLALARRLPWKELAGGVQLNVLFGFAVCLTLIWSMKAGVKPGLNLHLLGAMAATLALGPWKAVAALALALVLRRPGLFTVAPRALLVGFTVSIGLTALMALVARWARLGRLDLLGGFLVGLVDLALGEGNVLGGLLLGVAGLGFVDREGVTLGLVRGFDSPEIGGWGRVGIPSRLAL